MGDLSRYQAKGLEDKTSETKWESRNYEESWSFYNRAKTVYPFEGKIYNQLAVFSIKEKDYLASIYYFMWALSCHFPFETSKESLIDHFEEIRLKFNQEKALANSRYSMMRGGSSALKR